MIGPIFLAGAVIALPPIAVVVRGDDVDAARAVVVTALAEQGVALEPASDVDALVAEAERADRTCPAADAPCWAKVGAYGGFKAFVVVLVVDDARAPDDAAPGAQARPLLELHFLDVSAVAHRGPVRANASEVPAALRSLLDDTWSAPPVVSAPEPSPSAAPPPPPSGDARPPPASARGGLSSTLWMASGGALAVSAACGIAAGALDVIAADHIARLERPQPNDAVAPREHAQAALAAESWEIGTLACAGVTAVAAIGAGIAAVVSNE